MNNVEAREPVSFCGNGLIAETPRPVAGNRVAITCRPISRLRSDQPHNGVVAACLPNTPLGRNSYSSSMSTK